MQSLTDLTMGLSRRCRGGVIEQAAYAARDYLKFGRDTWRRHGRRASSYCRKIDKMEFNLSEGSFWSKIREAADESLAPLHDTEKPKNKSVVHE
jgi:hypothetical protein